MDTQEILKMILSEVKGIKEGQERLETNVAVLKTDVTEIKVKVDRLEKMQIDTQQNIVKVVNELGNKYDMLEKGVAMNMLNIEKIKVKVS